VEAGVSAAWAAVVAVGIGTFALKAVGPVGVSGRDLPARARSLLELLAPAILAALVVTETFGGSRALVADARLLGVAFGLVAVALRAPLWAVVVAGAYGTALIRLIS
jgi:branched-subunit amino acid transport protein